MCECGELKRGSVKSVGRGGVKCGVKSVCVKKPSARKASQASPKPLRLRPCVECGRVKRAIFASAQAPLSSVILRAVELQLLQVLRVSLYE